MSHTRAFYEKQALAELLVAHADEYRELVNKVATANGITMLTCQTCGGPMFPHDGKKSQRNCSTRCRLLWMAVRLHTPEYRDNHRKLVATRQLETSQDPVTLRAARRLLDDEAGTHGRWLIEGSAVFLAARELCSGDMPLFKELPEEIQAQVRNSFEREQAS